MVFSKLILASLGLASVMGGADARQLQDDTSGSFKVALWGDLPYRGTEVDVFSGEYGPMYKKLQEGINSSGAEFAIHTGDVKSGGASCGASTYKRFRDLAEFSIPSLLTLGDNGWTDCHRLSNGNYDPIERLEWMRNEYYDPKGGSVMGETQLETEAQDDYPENQMFTFNNAAFGLVHVVGSNNALYDGVDAECDEFLNVIDPGCAAAVAEYTSRNAAVNEYVQETFEMAADNDSNVVFIVIQANIFDGPCGTNADPVPAGTYLGNARYGMVTGLLKHHTNDSIRPVLSLRGEPIWLWLLRHQPACVHWYGFSRLLRNSIGGSRRFQRHGVFGPR